MFSRNYAITNVSVNSPSPSSSLLDVCFRTSVSTLYCTVCGDKTTNCRAKRWRLTFMLYWQNMHHLDPSDPYILVDEPTRKVASDQLGLIHKQRVGTNLCANVLPTNMWCRSFRMNLGPRYREKVCCLSNLLFFWIFLLLKCFRLPNKLWY